MITVLSGIAEFEADMIRERQTEGIEEAKSRGVYKGRPHTYTDKHKGLQHALELFNDRSNNGYTVKEIAEITKISKATIYRAVGTGEYKPMRTTPCGVEYSKCEHCLLMSQLEGKKRDFL